MPAPDPVADAITRGLEAMIAADPDLAPPPQETGRGGLTGLLRRLRRLGEDGASGR